MKINVEEKIQNFIFPSSSTSSFAFVIKCLTSKTRIMKKTLLISTAFFLSAASFAQTKVTNSEAAKGQTSIQHNNAGTQVNSSENASSATTIHTGIVENAKNRSTDQIKEDNKAMAAEKQALAAQAKDKGQATAAAAKAKTSSTLEDNNADENSSLSGNVDGSTTEKSQVGKMTSAENQSVHATLKGDNRSQVATDKLAAKTAHKVNATSTATVHAAAAGVHAVHVKPVPVKAGVHVRTAAGIRIR